MTQTLHGQAAVVTGAGRGIGRAVALKLAAHGASVVLNDLDADEVAAVARMIIDGGGSAEAVAGDVTAPGLASTLVERAVNAYGGVDIVVNNAGYMDIAAASRISDQQWAAMLGVHMTAPFQLLRAASEQLRGRGSDSPGATSQRQRKVVNVTSLAGTTGAAGSAHYAAAKAGVIGLTQSLAKEWGRRAVNVNAVAFGLIDTRLTSAREPANTITSGHTTTQLGVDAATRSQLLANTPLRRAGTVEEAAGAVYLLCLPEADFITGHVLVCSGGASHRWAETRQEVVRERNREGRRGAGEAVRLLVEQRGPVLHLTLNRPERLNALDQHTTAALADIATKLSDTHVDDPRIRVVVLSGHGRAFCAGLDVTERLQEDEPDLENRLPEVILGLRRCPQIVVAALHGASCGAGLALALAADLRVAADTARISNAFIGLGLSGAELGLSSLLPRTIGLGAASELMLTNRAMSPDRALAVGLVNVLVPADDLTSAVDGVVADLLAASPHGLRMTKRMLREASATEGLSAVIAAEQQVQDDSMKQPEFAEALARFAASRRRPQAPPSQGDTGGDTPVNLPAGGKDAAGAATDARRKDIVRAAATVFHRSGYHKATLSDIANSVGITGPALYRYVRNKQALLLAVLEEGTEQTEAALARAEARADSPTEVLRLAQEGLAALGVDQRHFAAILQRDLRHLDVDARAVIAHRWGAIVERVAAFLVDGRPGLSSWNALMLARASLAVAGSPSHYRLRVSPTHHRSVVLNAIQMVCDSTALLDEPVEGPYIPAQTATAFKAMTSKREAIIGIATCLFRERGYHDVTMEDIADKVGVTVPTVYSYFATKADLMLLAQERGTAWLMMGVSRAVATGTSAEQALRTALGSYVQFGLDFPDVVAVVVRELQNLPEHHQHVVRQSQHDYVAELVRLVMNPRPSMKEVDAVVLTHAALAVVNEITRTETFRSRPHLYEELLGVVWDLTTVIDDQGVA